jgi:hypothetical protein
LIVPRVYKEIHIALMREVVAGKVTELVFNPDKVGSSDWEDRKPREAITARAVSVDDAYNPVSCS